MVSQRQLIKKSCLDTVGTTPYIQIAKSNRILLSAGDTSDHHHDDSLYKPVDYWGQIQRMKALLTNLLKYP